MDALLRHCVFDPLRTTTTTKRQADGCLTLKTRCPGAAAGRWEQAAAPGRAPGTAAGPHGWPRRAAARLFTACPDVVDAFARVINYDLFEIPL